MQKHSRGRGQKRLSGQTFPVNLGGHKIEMTRDQIIANGQGWQRCHGEHAGTKVNSLSIKRIGNRIFLKDGGKLAGYNLAELAVALPEIKTLIDGPAPTAA